MNVSDNNDTKDYGEVEIHETLDVPEETITPEDLYNQSIQQLEDTQYYRESNDEYQYGENICRMCSDYVFSDWPDKVLYGI